jgi:ABC-type transport system involved in multi-copper enzyme maturation permease subunit
MNAVWAIVRDTFREAFARKVFWGFYALSTLMILFFLLVLRVDIVEGASATVTLFGVDSVRNMPVQRIIQGAFAAIATFLYTWGLALAVFASGSLVPSLLEPGRIELLLSKPVSRVQLLLSRYLGILLVVAVNFAWLVLGVWIVLGAKTGIWNEQFLLTLPAGVFLFSVMLGLIVLAGVLWESAAVCVMIPIALMLMSPILAQRYTVLKLLSSEWSRDVYRGLYYVFPKVYDIGRIMINVVRERGGIEWMPVWSTALFGCVTLAAGVWLFRRRDF